MRKLTTILNELKSGYDLGLSLLDGNQTVLFYEKQMDNNAHSKYYARGFDISAKINNHMNFEELKTKLVEVYGMKYPLEKAYVKTRSISSVPKESNKLFN